MSITFEEFFIDWQEATAPSTPNTGYVRVYAKSDGKIYRKDDTGTETELGGSSFTSFTVAGGSGTPQTISNADTLTITGSNGITTSAGATDTITISGAAFIQSFTLAGGSGTPQTINNGNTLTIAGSGGITTSAGATDTVTVDGSAFIQSFTVAGGSGTPQTINNGNTLTIAGSGGITTSAGATDTITISGAAFIQSFTLTGDSGSSQTISNGDTLDIEGGAGIATVVGATDKVIVHQAWNYEEVLASTGAFDVTISSLTGYSSCKTVIIEFALRGTVGATSDNGRFTLNSDDTDSNYYIQRAGAVDGVAGNAEGAAATAFANLPANSSPANSFAGGRVIIFNPLSSQHKVFWINWTGRYDTAAMRTDNIGGVWLSTSAVTSFRIRTDNHPTDTFAIGSFVRVMFIQ